MNFQRFSLAGHVALLVPFCALMIFIWMTPVLLAGFPFQFSEAVLLARHFDQRHVLEVITAPLTVLIFWAFHGIVGWQNMMGWPVVSAVALALSLVPLWWSVYRLFDRRIAWLSIVIFSFMPMYWMRAVAMDGYPLAFLFLFTGFALFIEFFKKKRGITITLFGLCFGAALASNHAFATLLPWMMLAFFWNQRMQWRRAIGQVVLYLGLAYVTFTLPLLPNALQEGLPLQKRIAVFLPAFNEHYTGVTHLYPDEYTWLKTS
ncbi:MAG: glycosyltransferase family 39 protein [Candidatus Peribacteraceae bacterium]|nr:glycosyltransferase family 39 protein [Candidatus Peribacteraceae bacterium]